MDWYPQIGSETKALLELKLSDEVARKTVADEARKILARCPSPENTIQSVTGLALGYVQSGKTLSFTTLATLARDNGFPVVVVLGGTTKPLFDQSNKRLSDDLRYESRDDRKWIIISNPTVRDRQVLETAIAGSRDDRQPAFLKRTALLTVMKNATRIRSLNSLLRLLSLTDTPVLIIDDEADQAGLNTLVRQDDISKTHEAIQDLRKVAGRYGYVEYTATPQALFLISIIDTLSPEFAQPLSPGADYIGGQDYFVRDRRMLKRIGANELPTPTNNLTEPPTSFLEALRIFFVGVAAGLILDASGNRSMMIHPSRLKDVHGDYAKWAHAIRKTWQTTFAVSDDDPDRVALVNEFREPYNELASTVANLPDFDEIMRIMTFALAQTEILELNTRSGSIPKVNWKNNYSFVLIGGQAIDRGFTVEGLTVTYMPRSAGQGNADTIQQRARFFGYKRKVFGYCRVYLEDDVRDAFSKYVDHEEDVRNRLIDWGDRPLKEWKRSFYLDPMFEPTRRNVYNIPFIRGAIDSEWFSPRFPYIDTTVLESNRLLLKAFFEALGKPNGFIEGQAAYLDANLLDSFEKLLLQFKHPDQKDAEKFATYILQIRLFLDKDRSRPCDIIPIRFDRLTQRTAGTGGIKQLFSGRSPKTGPATYVGDREVCRPSYVTIQCHQIDVLAEKDGPGDPSVLARQVPILAIRLPTMQGGLEQPGNP